MKSYSKTLLITILSTLLSSCREIFNFVGATADLGSTFLTGLLKIIVIGFILAFVIGLIRQIFGLNKPK